MSKMYKRNDDDYMCATVDNEALIMNKHNGVMIGMNPAATAIWYGIEVPTNFDDLIKKLLDKFEVDQKQCEMDTSETLKKMIQQKLVFEILQSQ